MQRVIKLFLLLFLLLIPLVFCKRDESVRIGFIGGLSGRTPDLGTAACNGVILAVEQQNQAGGINGLKVELVIKDDRQDPEHAREMLSELVNQQLELVIGPVTSVIAEALLPVINQSRTILISPTATSTRLSNLDDNFLRVVSGADSYATRMAHYQFHKEGSRRISCIYDTSNRSYTGDWISQYQKEFLKAGGEVLSVLQFDSREDNSYRRFARQLAASRPDTVVISANALDSALLTQHLRKVLPAVRIVISEWGATERFSELAGAASEGVLAGQYYDHDDKSPRFVRFQDDYRKRFRQEPGFASVDGYNAAKLAFEAYSERKTGQRLKEIILKKGEFHGLQKRYRINRFGDAERQNIITVINNGRYRTLE